MGARGKKEFKDGNPDPTAGSDAGRFREGAPLLATKWVEAPSVRHGSLEYPDINLYPQTGD